MVFLISLSIEVASFDDKAVTDSVYRILCACDGDFYPPLSSRDSSVSASFSPANTTGTHETYFSEMKNQVLLVARDVSGIVGFMSFRHAFRMPELGDWNPVNYITTVCVDLNQRGKGTCSAFYDFMLNKLPPDQKCDVTATRTWSLNENHLRLLTKLNFSLVKKIVNDRGPGVDTVYYARRTMK